MNYVAKNYLVSAIVSTYISEEFMRGCLEDLYSQTIADDTEIIVVDSASPQNERAIVSEFLNRHNNIKYIRTENRETLYQAWNRGIKEASGIYITNANTDDRHRSDAFEIMAHTLDAHPDIALVYADQLYTAVPNETFQSTISIKRRVWQEYSYQVLRGHCLVSAQPMWRKSLHDRYGYFDESYASAGDWEFWLRVGRVEKFKKINKVLGLYYENPRGIEISHQNSLEEVKKIRNSYNIALSEASSPQSALYIKNILKYCWYRVRKDLVRRSFKLKTHVL
jgi:glycosyltransferase involved in cell wall biosynthesis